MAEQRDPEARGWWRNRHFWLSSTLDQQALVRFLVEEYVPTPIVSPWNKTSGFQRRLVEHPRYAIEASEELRFEPYRQRFALAQAVVDEKPEGWEKRDLVRRLLEQWPHDPWLATVADEMDGEVLFSPLALAGGMDGKMEFSSIFMESLRWLLLAERRPERRAAELLRAALFEEETDQMRDAVQGFFDPRAASSYAGADDGKVMARSNPWGLVLAMEGLVSGLPRVRSSLEGHRNALLPGEAKYDVVVPLWSEPKTFAEAGQGAGHQRFALAVRHGDLTLALASVTAESQFDLGRLGGWLEDERVEFFRWLRTAESWGSGPSGSRVLEEIGKLRLHATEAPGLSSRWGVEPRDGNAEFDLALSLASLGTRLHRALWLRPQMESFQGRDLCEKMVRLLRYRMWSSGKVPRRPNRAGIVLFNDPFWGCHTAKPEHLLAFLRGEVDEGRMEDLLHALCLVVDQAASPAPPPPQFAFLPASYRKLKAAFGNRRRDRRPAPLPVVEALCRGEGELALKLVEADLAGRGDKLEADGLDGLEPRRLAAAMLFPLPRAATGAQA